jgi:ferrous iron transport protein B
MSLSSPGQPLPAGVPAIPRTAQRARRRTVALLGNPNTGKTTLFNALSGLNQRVGNYPGVTVETKKGQMTWAGESFDLIDLPGTYSLAPRSPDEMVAIDVLLGRQLGETRPDVVLAIVDASNLDRNLYLTTQALELGIPVVVALNMLDLAESQGLRIDAGQLSACLGVPVVPIQANKRRGLDDLRAAVVRAASAAPPAQGPSFPPAFEQQVQGLQAALGPEVPAFLVRRLLLDVGGYTEERLAAQLGPSVRAEVAQRRLALAEAGCPVPAVEARARYGWIRPLTAKCVQRPAQRPVTWTDRLDRVLTHRVWGTLVFLALMFLVFQSIFTWARPVMKLLDDGKDRLAELLRDHLPVGPFTSLLTDGLVAGVGAVVIFLPQILILFLFIAILEDCGYMARAAFLMDRLMARCGLSGKSFIPLLSSVACAVPGIMAARVIEDRRDRLATILVAPLMSCSARLPVYILLIGAFLTAGFPFWLPGLVMFGLYALGLVLAPLVAWGLKRSLLRGQTPVFVMEMPAYKWPAWRGVVRRMFDSGWAFVRRAGTLILASMVLVWALLYFPAGSYPQRKANLERQVKQEREQLKELEDSIRSERREIDRLKRLQERGGRPDGLVSAILGLFRAPPPAEELARRRKELEEKLAPTEREIEPLKKKVDEVDEKVNGLLAEWTRQSYLGRLGQAIEPAVRPLGWDWRVGVAALASFPAREVVVGTLGIIYQKGKVDSEEVREAEDVGATDLGAALRKASWDNQPERKVFTVPAVLSLLVFFALCCQCASTLAVIYRETRSWRWPLFTFTYMTVLAYLGALLVYQVGSRIGGV